MANNIFPMLIGANFWFNPLSECQKPMPSSEIALLLSGAIYATVQKPA